MEVRHGNPVQLELSFFGERTVGGAVNAYLARMTDDLAEATLADYQDRGRWCIQELGELTPLEAVGYDHLEAVARRYRGVLRNVTIKRRLVFFRACLKFAHARGLLDRVPALPRMKNDGEAKTTIHTVEQWKVFRTLLPPGAFRDFYDLGFWTLHHTADLFSMQRCMLDLDRPYHDEQGREVGRGMYLRRNQKNRRCQPYWLPMQPELASVVPDILARTQPLENAIIVGRLWNLRRTLHMAADRAVAAGHDIPRVSPIDLRRSGASMLSGRGYPLEYIRLALGHEGGDSHIQGGRTTRPTTATRHYMRPTPALISMAQTPAEGTPSPRNAPTLP